MEHLDRLLTWINDHDCGVSPTGILTANGTIRIRVLAITSSGERIIETAEVTTLAEARDALGY